MSLIVNCPSRSSAFLLTTAIEAAGLPGPESHPNSIEFLKRIACKQPRFALLTQESITHADVFTTIRDCSPTTSIVVCLLNDPIMPVNVWEIMDVLEIDVFCTLSELTNCLITLQQDKWFRSSLWTTHSAFRTKQPLIGWHDLTSTERRVLRELLEIRTGPQIADALHISPKTVNNHKAHISQKLNVSGGPGSLTRFVVTNRDQLRQLLE